MKSTQILATVGAIAASVATAATKSSYEHPFALRIIGGDPQFPYVLTDQVFKASTTAIDFAYPSIDLIAYDYFAYVNNTLFYNRDGSDFTNSSQAYYAGLTNFGNENALPNLMFTQNAAYIDSLVPVHTVGFEFDDAGYLMVKGESNSSACGEDKIIWGTELWRKECYSVYIKME